MRAREPFPSPLQRVSEPAVRSPCFTARKEDMQAEQRATEADLSTRRPACVTQNQIPDRHQLWRNPARAPRANEDRSLCACLVSIGRYTKLRQLPRTSRSRTISRSPWLEPLAWTSRSTSRAHAANWSCRSALDHALNSEKPPECLPAKGGVSITWSPNASTSGSNTSWREALLLAPTVAQHVDAASGTPSSACRCACPSIASDLQ